MGCFVMVVRGRARSARSSDGCARILGQHLLPRPLAADLVEHALVERGELIVEIGAGRGARPRRSPNGLERSSRSRSTRASRAVSVRCSRTIRPSASSRETREHGRSSGAVPGVRQRAVRDHDRSPPASVGRLGLRDDRGRSHRATGSCFGSGSPTHRGRCCPWAGARGGRSRIDADLLARSFRPPPRVDAALLVIRRRRAPVAAGERCAGVSTGRPGDLRETQPFGGPERQSDGGGARRPSRERRRRVASSPCRGPPHRGCGGVVPSDARVLVETDWMPHQDRPGAMMPAGSKDFFSRRWIVGAAMVRRRGRRRPG